MSWAVLHDASVEEVINYSGNPAPWALRVTDWWQRTSAVAKKSRHAIGLSRLSLALVRVDTLGALYDKQTPLLCDMPVPLTRPFILFYAIPPGQPSGWQGAIHILGLALTDKLDSIRSTGDLLHTYEYALDPEASLRWSGASNPDFWFTFCFEPPTRSNDKDDETVSTEYIAYRAQLADVFWSNRNNPDFAQKRGSDGYEMLCQLHEGDGRAIERIVRLPNKKKDADASSSSEEEEEEDVSENYFELCSDRGRAREYISYWMFALSAVLAPRDSFMKKKRAHFERELLRFRLQRYFFRDGHFARLISENAARLDEDDVRVLDDPGDRERELYNSRRQRAANRAFASAGAGAADEEQAKRWISVPEQHAGKEIVGDPLYDIDVGRVIITRHELFQWAWTRMELGIRRLAMHLSEGHKERTERMRQAHDRQHLFPRQLAIQPVSHEAEAADNEDTCPAPDNEQQQQQDDDYWSLFSEEHRLRERAIAESREEAARLEQEEQHAYNAEKEKEGVASVGADPGVYYSNEERRYWLARAKRRTGHPILLTPPLGPPIMPLETSRGLLRMDMAIRQLHHAAKAEDARDNAAIEALRLMRLGPGGGGGGAGDGLTLERVKRSFPPCMGRIVMDALVHRTHPKHKSRVSLVKFLLDAGFSVPDVDKLVYDMYEADRDYVYNEHQGRWDKEAYDTVFKDAVKNLHTSIVVSKHISPYGCAHLTGYSDKEQRGEQKEAPPALYGCPFSSSVPGQRADMASARSYLQWAGVQAPDIEDIVKQNHPQLCCSKYYLERFPENNGLTINHPNQFVRGAVLVDTKKKRQKIDLNQPIVPNPVSVVAVAPI